MHSLLTKQAFFSALFIITLGSAVIYAIFMAGLLDSGNIYRLYRTTSVPTNHTEGIGNISIPKTHDDYIPDLNDTNVYVLNRKPCPKNSTMLLLIFSAPHNFKKRANFRLTTGTFWNMQRKTLGIFFLGLSKDDDINQKIQEESDKYGDIVLLNYTDSYNRLVHKAMFMFNWAEYFCQGVKYVLKVDDDRIVNIPALVTEMDKHSMRMDHFFLCLVWVGARPQRAKESMYYVSENEYRAEYYPKYCGSTYAFKSDMIANLIQLAFTRPLLRMEDVFFTGILAETLGYKRIHDSKFKEPSAKSINCGLKNILVSGEFSETEMMSKWEENMSKKC